MYLTIDIEFIEKLESSDNLKFKIYKMKPYFDKNTKSIKYSKSYESKWMHDRGQRSKDCRIFEFTVSYDYISRRTGPFDELVRPFVGNQATAYPSFHRDFDEEDRTLESCKSI